MALDLVAPSAPSQTYARINAAIAAVNALQAALPGKAAQAAVDTLNAELADLRDLVGDKAGQAAVDAIQQALATLTTTVNGKASQSALVSLGMTVAGKASSQQFNDLLAALQALTQTVGTKAPQTALDAALARFARINAGLYPAERPGDNPSAFTASSAGGDPDALAPLDLATYPIRVVGDGLGVEVSGSREVWSRRLQAAETGRLWRPRWRLTRIQNAQDPDGDAVERLIKWYRSDRSDHSIVQAGWETPLVAQGSREFSGFLGDAGAGAVTFARPPGALYFRVGIKAYGNEARTVLTDLGADDVSDVRDAVLSLVPEDSLPALSARIDEEISRATNKDDQHDSLLSGLRQDLGDLELDVGTEVARAKAAEAAALFGIGEIYSTITPLPQLNPAVGAFPSTIADGRVMGAYINQGGRGTNALVEHRFPLNVGRVAPLAGREVTLNLAFNVNAEFNRTLVVGLNVVAGTAVRGVPLLTNSQTRPFPTLILVTLSFLAVGDETYASPYSLNGTDATRPQDDYWTLVSLTGRITAAPAGTPSLADQNHVLALARSLDAAKAVTAIEVQRATAAEADLGFGLGDIYALITPLPQLASPVGAFPSTIADGRTMGAYIAQGFKGTNALVEYRFPFNAARSMALPGREVRLVLYFNVNPAFARTLVVGLNVVAGSAVRGVVPLTYKQTRTDAALIVVEMSFLTVGDETAISPYALNGTDAASAQDDYWTLGVLSARVVVKPAGPGTVADDNAQISADYTAQRAITNAVASSAATAVDLVTHQGAVYAREVTVRPDGTGDYLSPAQAHLNITGATATKKVIVTVAPGIYGDVEWSTKDYVDMRGAGRDVTILAGDQPDNTPLDLITLNSTFRMNGVTSFSNMRVTIRNGRYAVHPDFSGTNPNLVYTIEDSWIEHLGNAGARAWQAANGGNPAFVWGSTHGWGGGTASGQVWKFSRNVIVSVEEVAFYKHNNVGFAKPSKLLLEGNRLLTKVQRTGATAGGSVWLDSLGSGQRDVCEMLNNELGGPIIMGFQPWPNNDPKMQIADRAEWRIEGSGNTPVAFIMYDDGARALRIESADTTSASRVDVSGSAVAALLGVVRVDRGGGGLKGAVYGTWDVGITTIGSRLGDCRTTNKVLIVTANGVTVTVTFNQDYRAQSNATILAAINAALGANATASLMWVSERYRPHFHDQEAQFYNADTVALRRKRAVAYADSDRAGRVMTSLDPAWKFAGVAIEDIRPGEWGRVKTRGVVAVGMDLDRSDGVSFVWGDTFGVSDASGRFAVGADTPLMRAINPVDVAWENGFFSLPAGTF